MTGRLVRLVGDDLEVPCIDGLDRPLQLTRRRSVDIVGAPRCAVYGPRAWNAYRKFAEQSRPLTAVAGE